MTTETAIETAMQARITEIREAFENDDTRIHDQSQYGPWAPGEPDATYGSVIRVVFDAEYMPRANCVPFSDAKGLLGVQYPSYDADGESRVSVWAISDCEALIVTTNLPRYCDEEGDGSGFIDYYRWLTEDLADGQSQLLEASRREVVEEMLAPLRANLPVLLKGAGTRCIAELVVNALQKRDRLDGYALSQEVVYEAQRWHERETLAVLKRQNKVARIDIEAESAIDDEGGAFIDVHNIALRLTDGTQLDFFGVDGWWDAFNGSDAEAEISPFSSPEQANAKLEERLGVPDWSAYWDALYAYAIRHGLDGDEAHLEFAQVEGEEQ